MTVGAICYIVMLFTAIVASYLKFLVVDMLSLTNLVLFAALLGWYFAICVREKSKFYRSYHLELDHHHITELYYGVEQSSFQIEDVIRTDKGGWYISGGDISIYVPSLIGDKEVFESSLPSVRPTVYKESKGLFTNYPFILTAILVICLIAGSKFIMTVSAVLILLILANAAYLYQFKRGFNQQEKNGSYVLIYMMIWVFLVWGSRF
ncbi:MAG: hypothetical protein K0Q66_1350 [Chitinophagaceae bacterium]|nr:hypothetical protein [Chitinophagaceae bacterium]